jgi:hypothetical protein
MSLWTYLAIIAAVMALLGFTLTGRNIAGTVLGGLTLIWAGISWERMATLHVFAGQEQAPSATRFAVLLAVLALCLAAGVAAYLAGLVAGRAVNGTHPAREP